MRYFNIESLWGCKIQIILRFLDMNPLSLGIEPLNLIPQILKNDVSLMQDGKQDSCFILIYIYVFSLDFFFLI